ncbi:hypothetical protein SDC9_190797 [bioreactor metagenome]|uniref:Uncharacterized protein n=1 Tax=bioreactor metagenome TaxID=1076179 RepID=A0A645HW46_9ZZZZ
MVEADRGDALFGGGGPGFRIDVAHAVADFALLRIKLDVVAGGQREAHALAGFQQFAGRDAAGGDAIGVEVLFQLVERCAAIDLEGKEVDAGAVGLTQDHAVMIALVPGLEIDAPLRVAAGFREAEHVRVKLHALIEIEHLELDVPGTKYACHCHLSAPLY